MLNKCHIPDTAQGWREWILFEDGEFNKTWFVGIYYLVEDIHKWVTNYTELCPKHRCNPHTVRAVKWSDPELREQQTTEKATNGL